MKKRLKHISEYGQIRHKDYQMRENLNWEISADCQAVHIFSIFFKTYAAYYRDTVTIDGIEYFGDMVINQLVPNNVIVYFAANSFDTEDGFILNWTCSDFGDLSWAEWTQLTDGTCNQQRKLSFNGSLELAFGLEIEALIGPTTELQAANTPCGKLRNDTWGRRF